jgi:hypothetical protein
MSLEFLLIVCYKSCETSIYNGNREKLLIWTSIKATQYMFSHTLKGCKSKKSLSDSKYGDQKKIGLVFGNIMFVVMSDVIANWEIMHFTCLTIKVKLSHDMPCRCLKPPPGQATGAVWIRGWVGHRASLDIVAREKFYPTGKQTMVIQSIA